MWSKLKRFWLFDDPRSYGARAILRGAAEGLQAVGKEVRLFPFEGNVPNAAQTLRNDILQFNPDAILLANHPASLFLQQIGMHSAPCPMFVWIFDDPFIMGGEPYSPEEIVLVADPAFAQGAKERGASKVLFLPVAAPVSFYAEERAEYQAPLAYVGATSITKHMRQQMDPHIARYLDEIIARKLSNPAIGFAKLLETYPYSPEQRIHLNGQLAYYLYAESNRLSRLRFLEPLVDLGLKLYGNEAWCPQIANTKLADCFQGEIDPFSEYPHLIHSVTININLRSLQGFMVPTQRDFLVSRVGGFLLSTRMNSETTDWRRYDPENRFHLSEFPWSASCATPNELLDTARHYLEKERARKEWIRDACYRIADHHTFTHRMDQLGEMIDTSGFVL